MTLCFSVVLIGLYLARPISSYENNQAIMSNIERGEGVVAELESLLAQSSVASEPKAVFRTAFARMSSRSRSSDSSSIESDAVDIIGCSPLTAKTCCKVNVPPSTEARTRYSWNSACRFRERGNCGRGQNCFHRFLRHRNRRSRDENNCQTISTYYVQVPRPCPSTLTSCCEGEVWFRTGCISISELERWIVYLRNGGSGYPPCNIPTTTTASPYTMRRWNPCNRRRGRSRWSCWLN
ncbi:uncharacterized protein [Watersipora subatra]|uniref:uncharacterized protein n=1 Tax=Watersipora subatra TaxID=2589382 RepID=UPI00355BDC77